MDVGLLYSGGKDSTLAGFLLDPIAAVTCLCCTFGITDDIAHARASARTVGFDSRTVRLDETVAREAAAEIVDDVVAIETVERCFPTDVQSQVTGRLDAPKS
jgi:predicted subunit of tRNA(5-methylaminomethyl-2-thiouridylate) methyltransferase